MLKKWVIENIINNSILEFFEYNWTFKDPASVYAYHLMSVHHQICWYLIIVLALVYWCLYKIICDFTYKIWEVPISPLFYIFIELEKVIMLVFIKIISYSLKWYYYFFNLIMLYELGI